jgi:hypothetical protein
MTDFCISTGILSVAAVKSKQYVDPLAVRFFIELAIDPWEYVPSVDRPLSVFIRTS